MEDFIDTLADQRLAELLSVSMNGRGAFRRFKDVLVHYPQEREQWFQFQNARLRQRALEWLDDIGVEPEQVFITDTACQVSSVWERGAMARVERDESREQRTESEIIVDAYNEGEQALGWYYYLEDRLVFPFRARCVSDRRISPLRVGEGILHPVRLDYHSQHVSVELQGFVHIPYTDSNM